MRALIPLVALSLTLLCVVGCSNNTTPQQNPPEPDAQSCEALKTQRECYDAGCAFFTNAAALQPLDNNACQRGPSFGICLFAARTDGPERLTSYLRTIDDPDDSNGQPLTQTLQLGQDVELEGWMRCGAVAVPPDCDCDGR